MCQSCEAKEVVSTICYCESISRNPPISLLFKVSSILLINYVLAYVPPKKHVQCLGKPSTRDLEAKIGGFFAESFLSSKNDDTITMQPQNLD